MHIMEIQINPINTAPSFTMILTRMLVCYDYPSFRKTVAVNISAGPFESQNLTFHVVLISGDTALFKVPPVVSANGTLSFVASKALSGMALFNLSLVDSGGTVQGGRNRSVVTAFAITVEDFLSHSIEPVVYTMDEDTSPGFLQLLVQHTATNCNTPHATCM